MQGRGMVRAVGLCSISPSWGEFSGGAAWLCDTMVSGVDRAQRGSLSGTGLPAGTVTFVLGDVAGSTRLWEEHAADMSAVLCRLDEVVGGVVAAWNGTLPVEQAEGDSFVAAFVNARDATAFAAAVTRALREEPWPGGLEVGLRMGVHTGDARQRDDGRYMGEVLNRCARLRALAHPGQVLVSATTAALVADELVEGVFLRDLGVHHLRDLSRPERVSQLCGPGLPFEFPPLRSLNRLPHNLPVQLTTFIGRVGELAETTLLLTDRRLVTLVGAGGSGKTRLAVQLGAEVIDRFPGRRLVRRPGAARPIPTSSWPRSPARWASPRSPASRSLTP